MASTRKVAIKSFSERLDEAKRAAAAAAIKNRRSKSRAGSKHVAVSIPHTQEWHERHVPEIMPKQEELDPASPITNIKVESKQGLPLSEIPLRPVNKYSELKVTKKRKHTISDDGGPSLLPLSSSHNPEEASTAETEHSDSHPHPFAPAKRLYRKKAPPRAT